VLKEFSQACLTVDILLFHRRLANPPALHCLLTLSSHNDSRTTVNVVPVEEPAQQEPTMAPTQELKADTPAVEEVPEDDGASVPQDEEEPQEYAATAVLQEDDEEQQGQPQANSTCGKVKVGVHEFDPRLQKETYILGVQAIRTFDDAMIEYNLTFAEYLTKTAGRTFDPPIKFEMAPNTMEGIFTEIEDQHLDFLYANPTAYSCVGVEFGAQPLATIISRLEVRGLTFDLDVFGGVIFTRSDNYEINTLDDLKDRVIAAGAISHIMAGQLQFYEMEKAGMSYIMDPKQVVFTYNQNDVVHGVLRG